MRFVLLLAFLVGCSSASSGPAPIGPADRGPYVVGARTLTLTDAARGRTLPVEVWYPATEAARAAEAAGESITMMVSSDNDRARYADLLAAAPADCPTKTVHSARDAQPAEGSFPLVIVSHCYNCTRFTYASIAEHLASHGIAVAAPDHVQNTLFNALDMDALPLNTTTLGIRVADLHFVLNTLLDSNAAEVDTSLRGRFDAQRVAALGHSFGTVTAGVFTKEEPRVKALVGLATPIENALLPGVTMAEINKPVLMVVAKEDNSITEFGNDMIRDNYRDANPPVWKVELADAGHWSFTDIAGVYQSVMAGCGTAERQTKAGEMFTYPKVADEIDIVRTWTTAMFSAQLLGDATAKAWLESPTARAGVEVAHRNQ
jgi:dienelactone hydrolase